MWKLVAVVAVAACGFSMEVPEPPGPDITVGFEKPTSVVDRKTGVHQIRVKLSDVTTNDVTVHYQISGGTAVPPADYDLVSPETITIPAGQQFAPFEVKINPVSDADRPDQTIDITLVNPTGASIAFGLEMHEVTILAKALPRVSFETAMSSLAEPTDAQLAVKLDESSEFDVTVDYTVTPIGTYAIAGTDYVLAAGTLTFPAGTTTLPLTVDVLTDDLDEDDEGVEIVLENPTKAFIDMTKDRHTHTITDDDPTPSIAFQANQTVAEGVGNITVGVTLSAVSGRPVTVPYAVANGATATAGADFTVTGTQLTLDPGATTANIAAAIVQDTTDEPTESFQLDFGTLVNATAGTPASHVVSITDDDLICYGASPFAVCFDSPPTGDLAITTNINTTSSSLCAAQQPTGWTTAPQNQDPACVIARDTISIGAGANIAVTGTRPLVLVAATSITIDGTLDASSSNVAGSTGAASPSADCDAFLQNPGNSNNGAGAGAGATFVSIGGAGGTGGMAATQGGTPPPVETTPLPKLRAGCNGQAGGNGTQASGAVGRGGGAVYVVTGGTLTLASTAILNASGSGGAGGGHASGGSGGGSGGMIKVFFTTLAATAGAKIVSNGGGGASGGDVDGDGTTGQDPDPTTPATQAAGGPSGTGGATGGSGYAGGVAATAGDNGDTGSANDNGGGGGGGGGGYVQSNQALTNVTVSAGVIQIP